MKGERPSPPSAGRVRVANGSATPVVGATHVDDLVASDRGKRGRDAAVLARGCTPRAERVTSRYVRLDVRPARTSLFQLASPPLGLMQDEARGPTTRAGRAAECSESCYWVTVAGSVPQTGRGSGFIDGPHASRPVQSSRARWMVVRRGARKML